MILSLCMWSYCLGVVADLAVPVGQHGTFRDHLVTQTQVGIARSLFIVETLISGLWPFLMLPGTIEKNRSPQLPLWTSPNFIFHSWLLFGNCLRTLHFRLAALWELFSSISLSGFQKASQAFLRSRFRFPEGIFQRELAAYKKLNL